MDRDSIRFFIIIGGTALAVAGIIATAFWLGATSPISVTTVDCSVDGTTILNGYAFKPRIERELEYIDKEDFKKKWIVLPDYAVCDVNSYLLTPQEYDSVFNAPYEEK